MDRCLRGYVAEGDALIVLMNDVRGDFLVADLLEQRFVGHAW
jgi:hypothetical protein